VPSPGVAAAATSLLIWLLTATPSAARTTTALRVQSAGAPQHVHGSDGREHVEYDLIVTNVFSADATVNSLEVRGDGKRLLTLTGDALATVTHRLFASEPTRTIPPASTTSMQVDLVLPRSFGRGAPKRLTNRIRYTIPSDAPSRGIIGSTTVNAALRVDQRAPIVISAPLRGAGWVDANGCCGDPTSPHRETVLANGSYVTPEMFAVDWIREVDGIQYRGDGSQNSDWPGFGAPLYAVADGTVVFTADGLPDIPPLTKNPDLNTPADYAGNNVILKIAPGQYAVYDHMPPGSVRVRRGQRVRAGQQIGVLGNSGNTDGPHLHFGIQERPDSLSRSLPFEIDGFVVEGNARTTATPGQLSVVGPPRRVRDAHPLITSVATFTPRG
jgi:hypothetical protein